jgi:thiol-disulfide isomerase/thioredoxin
MQRRVAVAAALAAVVAVAGLVVAAGGGGRRLGPQPSTGEVRAVAAGVTILPAGRRRELPRFSAATVDGGQLDLASLRGQVLVLNFWAAWCGPCRSEQAGLEQASRQLAGDGVRFVGVDVRDTRASASAYLREFHVSYPSLFDPSSRLPQLLGELGPDYPPYTLIVDRQGRVAAVLRGALAGGQGTPAAQATLLAQVVHDATQEPAG